VHTRTALQSERFNMIFYAERVRYYTVTFLVLQCSPWALLIAMYGHVSVASNSPNHLTSCLVPRYVLNHILHNINQIVNNIMKTFLYHSKISQN